MAEPGSNRICTNCQRALSGTDEWISLDGGDIWCADCWRQQFGSEAGASAAEEPSLREIRMKDLEGLAQGQPVSAGEPMSCLRPCMTCGHLCAPDAENCPSCGGEPFPSGNRHAAQNEASEDSWASETVVTQAKGTGSRTDTESRIVHQINIGQQAPQAPQAASATKTSGLAVAALVLGIVGIVVLPFLAPQILALIFGAVARRDIPRNPALTGKGMATAGLVLGIIGVSLWFVWIIAWLEGGRTF